MREIEARHVADRELAGCRGSSRVLDAVVAARDPRAEAGEGEGVDIFSSGTPYCRPSETATAKLLMKSERGASLW
jgi:hypothetical protein